MARVRLPLLPHLDLCVTYISIYLSIWDIYLIFLCTLQVPEISTSELSDADRNAAKLSATSLRAPIMLSFALAQAAVLLIMLLG